MENDTFYRWIAAIALAIALGYPTAILAPRTAYALRWRLYMRHARSTAAGMEELARGLKGYFTDHESYPVAPHPTAPPFSLLVPKYVPSASRLDGWGTVYVYEAPAGNDGLATSYTLMSLGADSHYNGVGDQVTRYFDCDLVYTDGYWFQSPWTPEM